MGLSSGELVLEMVAVEPRGCWSSSWSAGLTGEGLGKAGF